MVFSNMLRDFRGVNYIFVIPGCYTAYIGSYLGRFGTTCGPIFKGQAVQEKCPAFLLGLFDHGLGDSRLFPKLVWSHDRESYAGGSVCCR